jgi:hypothetical protein
LRGAALHGVALVAVGLLLLSAARLGGFWLALAAYLRLNLGLLYAQLPLSAASRGAADRLLTVTDVVLESSTALFRRVAGLGGRTRVWCRRALAAHLFKEYLERSGARRPALIAAVRLPPGWCWRWVDTLASSSPIWRKDARAHGLAWMHLASGRRCGRS